MTGTGTGTPPTLLHNLEHNKVLHEQVVLLTVVTADVPQVAPEDRFGVEPLGRGFFRVTVAYGFTRGARTCPAALEGSAPTGCTWIWRRRPTSWAARRCWRPTGRAWRCWRERLFVLMSSNAMRATAFFKIPPERVVELGMQLEL